MKGRVDREKLKALLRSPKVRIIEAEVEAQSIGCNIFDSPAIRHAATGSDTEEIDMTCS